MHCNNLRLVFGLGLVRVISRVRVRIRVKVRLSVMARVSIRTSWVANFALFRCYWPVIYTRLLNDDGTARAVHCRAVIRATCVHPVVRPVELTTEWAMTGQKTGSIQAIQLLLSTCFLRGLEATSLTVLERGVTWINKLGLV